MPAAGILGWKRSKYWKPILHSYKSPETPRKSFLKFIRIIERKKYQRGPTPWPGGWGCAPLTGRAPVSWAPWWPSGAHLLLYEGFNPGNNHKEAYGTKLRLHEAEPWRNQSRAPVELLCRETSLREGEIIAIVITNDPLIGRGSISINIFISTISSQNPSSSLVSNLVSKPQIGTCGLLVVLITPCS